MGAVTDDPGITDKDGDENIPVSLRPAVVDANQSCLPADPISPETRGEGESSTPRLAGPNTRGTRANHISLSLPGNTRGRIRSSKLHHSDHTQIV